MNPIIHPDLSLLSADSAGTTPEAVSLAIARHLSVRGRCRAMTDGLDALGDVMLGEGRAEMREGAEVNLVLQGCLDDLGSDEAFLLGDLSVRSAEVEHGMRIHVDGPCTVLVVLEGRLLPRTLLGHVAAWLGGF